VQAIAEDAQIEPEIKQKLESTLKSMFTEEA
jgi:hypothetical protein